MIRILLDVLIGIAARLIGSWLARRHPSWLGPVTPPI
jgi:hypothetical protein